MSVICAPASGPAGTPAAPGVTPRRSSRLASLLGSRSSSVDGGSGGNVLMVKGAAECVLSRCSKVMLGDGSVVPLDSAARDDLHK